jgi:hypothetical protein
MLNDIWKLENIQRANYYSWCFLVSSLLLSVTESKKERERERERRVLQVQRKDHVEDTRRGWPLANQERRLGNQTDTSCSEIYEKWTCIAKKELVLCKPEQNFVWK